MREDARYDVADTEAPPLDDSGDIAGIRNRVKSPIHGETPPKVFLSNDCVFNCSYCGCRCGRDGKARYAHPPREFAELSMKVAKKNGNRLFITSAIHKNADYTEELIVETMRILRKDLGYKGYLHGKIMPGADPELIRQAGLYANRLSVNIEVARSEGYRQIARQKTKSNILGPMEAIARLICEGGVLTKSATTQLMAGSTGEDDYTILNLSKALYKKFRLSRVYYTPFHYSQPAAGYEGRPPVATPFWRMTRLYQADRLLELYGFTPEDLAPPEAAHLVNDFDPKAAWALRNLHLYPVEVNTADYEMLIRIPGIGITYAKRILEARKNCRVTHGVLRQLGVSLKRSQHFLTAGGIYEGVRSDRRECFTEALRSPLPDPPVSAACG
jgi:predicted DNA-binding helix-hairpin-helix protein